MGSNTTAPRLVAAVRQSFCHTGIPDIFWTDEGPQFTSKVFHDFVTRWRFEHKTSTPRYPQSNGKIEATVKSMKKIIRGSWTGRLLDDDKLCRALLQYRNTPSRKDGASPAQKLYGHPIQDALPAHRRSFSAEWQRKTADIEQQAAKTLETSTQYYNTHAHYLPEIHVGSSVALQNPQTKLWVFMELSLKLAYIGGIISEHKVAMSLYEIVVSYAAAYQLLRFQPLALMVPIRMNR